jgi:hypothetical protein
VVNQSRGWLEGRIATAAPNTEVVIKFDRDDRRRLEHLAEQLDTLIALLVKAGVVPEPEDERETLVITEAELRAELKRQGHPSEP